MQKQPKHTPSHELLLLGPPKSTVQGILGLGCFHPAWEQQKQVAKKSKIPLSSCRGLVAMLG